ncbi:MAG TPA: hypothetical protein VGE76_05670, partial [Opitutaceae bacterium]
MLAVRIGGSFAAGMFFLGLKRLVSFWLMPLQFCIVTMLMGLVLLRWTKWRRTGRALLVGGLVLLMLAGNHFVARGLIRPLETQYPSMPPFVAGEPPASLAGCKYVMVLGGGGGFSANVPATSMVSAAALGRVVEAVRILHALPEARLVVSGPTIVDGAPTHASMLAQSAI